MTSRLAGLLAAVLLALTGTMLAPAPAYADFKWQTIYETHRHIKAQACRTDPFTNPQGYEIKAVRWRGNARQASLGGAVQLRTISDRFGRYRSPWTRVREGKVSPVTRTHFLVSETVSIKMRVRSSNGIGKWSKAYSLESIKHC
jgi:hypothetical protein